jgi:hypothetical protein
VKPDTLYRLSAWILARAITSEGIGANLSVLGSTSAAGDLKDTGGQWQHVEFYGRTGPRQESLGVLLRLGFYGSLATGVAIFDDAKLEEVDQLPQGAGSISFGDNAAAEVFPVVTAEEAPPQPPPTTEGSWLTLAKGTPWMVLLALSVLAAATALVAAIVLLALVRVGKIPAAVRHGQPEKVTIEALIARDRETSHHHPVGR